MRSQGNRENYVLCNYTKMKNKIPIAKNDANWSKNRCFCKLIIYLNIERCHIYPFSIPHNHYYVVWKTKYAQINFVQRKDF